VSVVLGWGPRRSHWTSKQGAIRPRSALAADGVPADMHQGDRRIQASGDLPVDGQPSILLLEAGDGLGLADPGGCLGQDRLGLGQRLGLDYRGGNGTVATQSGET
ncbi:MAG: hypothetical protein QOI35_2174, partial [Cryptosporangiaceae bacterium]|nr:hypothetical protein [Cryptosporangiaceae bacterium]